MKEKYCYFAEMVWLINSSEHGPRVCHLYWPCISGATILRPEEGIIRSKASFGLISNPRGLKGLKAGDCSEL